MPRMSRPFRCGGARVPEHGDLPRSHDANRGVRHMPRNRKRLGRRQGPRAVRPVLLAVLFAAATALAQEKKPAEAPPACSDCHDEIAKAFSTNPHARGSTTKGVASMDACVLCHGDGAEHA